MSVGISTYLANELLDAIGNNGSFAVATVYVKLHTGGDPGSAGASNAAAETDRMAASFSAAASGAMTNDTDIVWTAVAASETYSHISLWDASSGGNFLMSLVLTANAAVAGADFTIPAGDLDLNFSNIAA